MPVSRVAFLSALLFVVAHAEASPWAPKKKAARDLINAAADAADANEFARPAALSLDSFTVEPSNIARWNAGEAFAAAGEWARALDQYDRALADRDLPRKRRPTIEARRSLARGFIDAAAAVDAQRWDDARAAYLAILGRDDLLPNDRQHAGGALEQLAQRRAAEAATRPAEPEGSTAPSSSPTTTAPPTPGPGPAPIDVRTPSRPSRWSDTPALAILGTGAIGVGVGAWLSTHAQGLDDQADAPGTPEPDRSPLRDRASTSRTGATIALAAGGALVIVGAIKLAIPPNAPRPTVATLQPTAGGALVVVGGTF